MSTLESLSGTCVVDSYACFHRSLPVFILFILFMYYVYIIYVLCIYYYYEINEMKDFIASKSI